MSKPPWGADSYLVAWAISLHVPETQRVDKHLELCLSNGLRVKASKPTFLFHFLIFLPFTFYQVHCVSSSAELRTSSVLSSCRSFLVGFTIGAEKHIIHLVSIGGYVVLPTRASFLVEFCSLTCVSQKPCYGLHYPSHHQRDATCSRLYRHILIVRTSTRRRCQSLRVKH